MKNKITIIGILVLIMIFGRVRPNVQTERTKWRI